MKKYNQLIEYNNGALTFNYSSNFFNDVDGIVRYMKSGLTAVGTTIIRKYGRVTQRISDSGCIRSGYSAHCSIPYCSIMSPH